MSTANAIYLIAGGHRVALDSDSDTQLLVSYQANDRTDPSSIESPYSQETTVPGTAHNHRLLKHAAASQPTTGQAYKRVPAVLTSGDVETLPLAILYIKGYSQGRYTIQVTGGNKRLVESLGDKKLIDLDLSRFNHDWTAENVLAGLPFEHWQARGWGYEVYERGKPVDLQALNPYDLYPSCSANLVWTQILADAGFTADSLLGEPLFAALNVPSANPYIFSQEFREARQLKAGFEHTGNWFRLDEFQELAPLNFVGRKPYVAGKALDTSNGVNQYVVPTLGYYDLNASLAVYFGCNERGFGEVSMKVVLRVNGAPLLNPDGTQVEKGDRFKGYKSLTLAVDQKRVLLKPGDVVDVQVQGDKWDGTGGIGPDDPEWFIGTRVVDFPGFPVTPFSGVEPACSFSVDLSEEFPPGGRVKLNEWLPDMKQLDFVKAYMLAGGLTIQTDAYEPYLRLATGEKLLANVSKAKDWTAKRSSAHRPGRLPERDLAYRFGEYGQTNLLKWQEDEHVTKGYGDGSITVADEVLPKEYELATLPFAATESSPVLPGLLRILNFETDDELAKPVLYSKVGAKPRLVIREAQPVLNCQLITTPAVVTANSTTPAVLTAFTTTASYFSGDKLSLELNRTVLTDYWADLRAMLDQSRYLTERYRLTPRDIAELDFSVPIWDGLLGDYFAVSQVSEYDARRPVEVVLCRLNAAHLGPPKLPSGVGEFYTAEEFYAGEFY